MTKPAAFALLLGAAILAGAGPAEAGNHQYVGMHPIAGAGAGFCFIEGPHVHVHAPEDADVLYRVHDGAYFFIGDPVPYGYDGPRHAYHGHHPVPVDVLIEEDALDGDDIEFCYLDGPHYHAYAPPSTLKFELKGGVHWFVGELPVAYRKGRTRYLRINVIYKRLQYVRPVITVEPPAGVVVPVIRVEAPAAVPRVIRAKEIRADRVIARVIYAKEVKARWGRVGRVYESREDERWERGRTDAQIDAAVVQADVIYAKEIFADHVQANAVHAKEVKIGR